VLSYFLLTFILAPAISFPSFPGWSQYVNFLKSILDTLATSTNSGGLAIVIFTIGIKTLLMPLTVKSIRSSKAMQELQPKIKELQKKHGKDRQELSAKTMELYAQHGVNPMAGCLPMLIQIPIFFGVYRAIIELSNSHAGEWADGFLWLGDLSNADPWKVLPIAAGVFQFVQTKMMRPENAPKATDPQQALMNQMMNFMPLMVVVFGWTFASGAVIYWVTQSIFSVIQQWFITGWGSMKDWAPWLPEMPDHRRLGYRPPRDPNEVVVVSGGGAQGWLQKKMAQAQEQSAVRAEAAKAQRDEQSGASANGTNGRKRGQNVVVSGDEEETEGEAAAATATTSSYQARVDAASRHPARARRANGNGKANGNESAAEQGEAAVVAGNGARKAIPRKAKTARKGGSRSRAT
jgi:YidC/Oxa1 family membrane protein insertase